MRKLFVGAVACAVTATSSLVAFGPGPVQAQESPGFDLLATELSPAEASVGDEITVTPVDDCSATTGYLAYALFEAGEFSWENPPDEQGPVLVADVPLAEDGSWVVTFPSPDQETDEEIGEFSPAALAEEEPEPELPGMEVYADDPHLEVAEDGTWNLAFPAPDDGDAAAVTFYALWLDCENDTTVTGFYDLLLFAVGDRPLPAPPTEPPTRPESPRPARPIVVAPDFTG